MKNKNEGVGEVGYGTLVGRLVNDRLEEIEGVEEENRKLRAIFPKILDALGSGGCLPECSIGFLQEIPGEVSAVVASLKANRGSDKQGKRMKSKNERVDVGSGDLFGQLDRLITQKGSLQLSYDKGGGGMGYYYCATLGKEWPYCHAGTPEGALRILVSEHLRLEREELQKRINEIDGSAGL